ncbi:MAG: hypothetical protein ACOX1X_08480 [Dethiobacteria bacterium]
MDHTFPLAPQRWRRLLFLEFLTPEIGAAVASGLARPGEPSPEGQAFIITVRVTSRGDISVKEGSSFSPGNIGMPNPSFPDFVFTFNTDFILPDGTVSPPGTNLAALFQFAGSNRVFRETVVTDFMWFVGGSIPPTAQTLTMFADIRNVEGESATGIKTITVDVIPNISGDSLTVNP